MKKITLKESIEKIEKILGKTIYINPDEDSIDDEMLRIIFLDVAVSFIKYGSIEQVKEVTRIMKSFDKSELPF